MSIPVSVVINCAGMGRRLGLSTTKALAQICGRPLIAWHLDALKWVDDIRIVVGYQATDVIECVKKIRRDVIFTFNHAYETTGTAASLVLGAKGARNLVLSLDGDLLVRPQYLHAFMEYGAPALGVLPPNSDEPLKILLNENQTTAIGFNKNPESTQVALEWSGLCVLSSDQIAFSQKAGCGKNHVYELITPHLPLPIIQIDAREIDTPGDFERAEQWLKEYRHEWGSI